MKQTPVLASCSLPLCTFLPYRKPDGSKLRGVHVFKIKNRINGLSKEFALALCMVMPG